MPRYINQPEITFEDKNDNKYIIKDFVEIQTFDTAFTAENVNQKTDLDELASRKETFGEGAEYLAYTIFYHNIEKIVENDFDLSKLKTIKIPVVVNL